MPGVRGYRRQEVPGGAIDHAGHTARRCRVWMPTGLMASTVRTWRLPEWEAALCVHNIGVQIEPIQETGLRGPRPDSRLRRRPGQGTVPGVEITLVMASGPGGRDRPWLTTDGVARRAVIDAARDLPHLESSQHSASPTASGPSWPPGPTPRRASPRPPAIPGGTSTAGSSPGAAASLPVSGWPLGTAARPWRSWMG